MVDRIGKHKAMSEWLQGLALNIPYSYYGIIQLAIKLGSIDDSPSDKMENIVCKNYGNFMAGIILTFKRTRDNENA